MGTTRDNAIFVNAFVEVSDDVRATSASEGLSRRLSRHGEIARIHAPERYWKIPEYWELFIVIRPDKPVPLAFDCILDELASSGWDAHRSDGDGSWAVWAARPESVFALPDVRWANVECFRFPDPAPERGEGNS